MQNYNGSHFPILGIMFLIFMTLKLCGVITWSWIWVTAPLWIPVALLVSILVFCGLGISACNLMQNKNK